METRDFGLDTDASVQVHRCNKCPVQWVQAVYVWGRGYMGDLSTFSSILP